MKCLRCGYCCKHYFVPVIDDPEKGVHQDNIVIHEGNGTSCKHLEGAKPGEYSCAVHREPWYEGTPCFDHGQVENSEEDPCRIGVAFIERVKNGKA
jgi:hypothetical protein